MEERAETGFCRISVQDRQETKGGLKERQSVEGEESRWHLEISFDDVSPNAGWQLYTKHGSEV